MLQLTICFHFISIVFVPLFTFSLYIIILFLLCLLNRWRGKIARKKFQLLVEKAKNDPTLQDRKTRSMNTLNKKTSTANSDTTTTASTSRTSTKTSTNVKSSSLATEPSTSSSTSTKLSRSYARPSTTSTTTAATSSTTSSATSSATSKGKDIEVRRGSQVERDRDHLMVSVNVPLSQCVCFPGYTIVCLMVLAVY